MALVRRVIQNKETQKWAYVEYSTEESEYLTILGGKEFDTEEEAEEWSKGFDIHSYEHGSNKQKQAMRAAKIEDLRNLKAGDTVYQYFPSTGALGIYVCMGKHPHTDKYIVLVSGENAKTVYVAEDSISARYYYIGEYDSNYFRDLRIRYLKTQLKLTKEKE